MHHEIRSNFQDPTTWDTRMAWLALPICDLAAPGALPIQAIQCPQQYNVPQEDISHQTPYHSAVRRSYLHNHLHHHTASASECICHLHKKTATSCNSRPHLQTAQHLQQNHDLLPSITTNC